MNKRTIITDNTEPPKNYLWHKLSPAGLDLGIYEYRDGKWNKIEIGGGGSELEETNFDDIITGFYTGKRKWDSQYTYQYWETNKDISEFVTKESNGKFLVSHRDISGSDYRSIVVTTNIDNLIFKANYVEDGESINGKTILFLTPGQLNTNYTTDYNLLSYVILMNITN